MSPERRQISQLSAGVASTDPHIRAQCISRLILHSAASSESVGPGPYSVSGLHLVAETEVSMDDITSDIL